MKILVTGANGQVGREFRSLTTDTLDQMIFISRRDLDFANRDQILDVLAANSPDVVINCAAYTAVDKAETEPDLAFSVNAHGTGVLAKGCAANRLCF